MTKEELAQVILSSERQLYAAARSVPNDDQDCADAIQETIVRAFAKVHTLRADICAKARLMRILINECHTIARQRGRTESPEAPELDPPAQPEEPRDYTELYRAVGALKEELRVPVILYYIEGFHIKQIAQILHISEGNVQKRPARAREERKASIRSEDILS